MWGVTRLILESDRAVFRHFAKPCRTVRESASSLPGEPANSWWSFLPGDSSPFFTSIPLPWLEPLRTARKAHYACPRDVSPEASISKVAKVITVSVKAAPEVLGWHHSHPSTCPWGQPHRWWWLWTECATEPESLGRDFNRVWKPLKKVSQEIRRKAFLFCFVFKLPERKNPL